MSNGFRYDWDAAKRRTNMALHGVDFAACELLDWDAAIYHRQIVDGEERFLCYAPIENRLFAIVITIRDDVIRVISLRKANSREARLYAESI